ncbi:MAG: nucleotidyltransferase domain-containing protein [Anaerolineales bacterium]|nr:nucleotidyltransferase domain-containing protein [Anaerolineales bacterium]
MVAAKPLALSQMTPKENEALQTFIQRLLAGQERQIVEVILFGSKARGNSTPDSDVDVLILAKTEDRQLQKAISKISSQIDLDYDILLNSLLIADKRWKQMSKERFSLCRNIERDGILLYRLN